MKTRSSAPLAVFSYAITWLTTAVALSACSVYQSPQRDSFNSNAKANAPAASATGAAVALSPSHLPLSADWDPCSAISSESLSLLFEAPHLDLIRHHDADSASCTIVTAEAPHMSSWRTSCLLRLGTRPAINDAFALFQPAQVSIVHFSNGETWSCESELNAEPLEIADGTPQLRAFHDRFNQFVILTVSRLQTTAPPQFNLSPSPDLRP